MVGELERGLRNGFETLTSYRGGGGGSVELGSAGSSVIGCMFTEADWIQL